MTKYRTIITGEGLSEDQSALRVETIGWRSEDERNTAEVPIANLPQDIVHLIAKGEFPIYLICRMNLGAESADQLDMTDFEIAPEPDPNDGLA